MTAFPARHRGRASGAGKRPWGWILLLGIATLLRAAHVASLAGPARFHLDGLLSDARSYHEWATGLAAGTRAIQAPFAHAPGYPFALAALYRFTGPNPLAVVVVQSLLGIVTVLLTHRIATRVLGRSRAIPAALLTTLYAPLLWTEGKLLTETVFLCLSLAGILRTLRLAGALPSGDGVREEGGSARRFPRALLAGGIWGLAIGIRPIALLSTAAAAVWLAARRERWSGRFVAVAGITMGALAVLAPIPWLNVTRGHDRVLVSTNAGINFWFGNEPGARPSFLARTFRFGSFERQGIESRRAAEEAVGHPLLPSQAAAYWMRQGWRSIRSDPWEAARREGRKLLAMLSNFEYGVDGLPSIERRDLPVLWVTCVPFAAILALAALGLAARLREPRPTPGLGLLLLYLAGHAAGILIFFHYSRFRLPMIPVLGMLAAEGLCSLGTWRRHPRSALAAGIAAGGLLVVSLVVLPDRDTHRLQEAGASLYLAESIVHGDGPLDEAEEVLARCLALEPSSARARLLQGVIQEKQGDWSGARARYEEAIRAAPTFPSPHVRLGRLLGSGRFGRGDALREAIHHLERALDLGAYDPSLRVERAALLLESNRLDEAEPAFEALTGEDELAERAWFGLGECRRRRGDLDGAREAWREGLRARPGAKRLRDALRSLGEG